MNKIANLLVLLITVGSEFHPFEYQVFWLQFSHKHLEKNRLASNLF